MDFKNIPVTAQPAYTWLWNDTVTWEGIQQQLEECITRVSGPFM